MYTFKSILMSYIVRIVSLLITIAMEFYLEPSWRVCTSERCAYAARNSQDAQQDALHGPNRATQSQTKPNRARQNPTVPPASYLASFCSGMHWS